MKRYIALFTAVLLIAFGLTGIFETEAVEMELPNEIERFSDVPEKHWAYDTIHYFRYLDITRGIGENKFGLGQTVKKGEFITMLVRLMGWEIADTEDSSFPWSSIEGNGQLQP